MPEEKKDQKVTPSSASSAEGKKKEAFTFSDKIKNSKQAGSKSFANRGPSKIGSDGKPRQTLFERTKRDAPFFIAALVALLLLPFLYKYSGNVNEEPTMVTPGGADTVFDPDAMRSGFDFTGDPEQVVALQSGRDSIDYILGLGSNNNEDSDSSSLEDMYARSAFDDSSVATSASTEIGDEENNTTNIYRYRKGAKPATRAAFRRAATKLNRLAPGGMVGRSGGKLGVGMWGGNLKTAAKKVRGETPTSAPKPVSLQPLQAAGKPSRSYFGNNAGAEARRSRDAMSKSNALQALNDAQMRPVDPGKIGGIFGGDFGGPGGGNGKLDRAFTFNGKEPWWWDLMKTRSQMEWEKKFNRKWNWIEWGDKLLQKLFDGILSCVLTGTDDWSMGRMFGAKEGSGKEAKCLKFTKEAWEQCSECLKYGPFGKKSCVGMYPSVDSPWQDGATAATNLGFFGSRLDCLTNGIFDARKNRKAGEGVVTETNDCNSFYLDGRYRATVRGKYTLFHYVVGVRRENLGKYNVANSAEERKQYLEVAYIGRGGDFGVDPNTNQHINNKLFVPLFIESVAIKNKSLGKKCESDDDIYCVHARKDSGVSNTVASGKGTISADDLEGMMAQLVTPSSKNSSRAKATVLKYTDLLEKLRNGGIMVSNTTASATAGEQVSTPILSAKGGKAGKGWVLGARCAYPLAFASCHNNGELAVRTQTGEVHSGMPAAFITIPNAQQMKAQISDQFMVVYRIQGEDDSDATSITSSTAFDKSRAFFANVHASNKGYPNDAQIINDGGLDFNKPTTRYTLGVTGRGKEMLEKMQAGKSGTERRAIVTWEIRQCYDPVTPWGSGRAIFDGACGRAQQENNKNGVVASSIPGTVVSSATCVYYDGDGVSPGLDEDTCENDQQSAQCCSEKHPEGGYVWKEGRCVQECPNGADTSAECCAKLKPQATWNAQTNKCEDSPVVQGQTRLAPYIAWVPGTITERKPVELNVAPVKGDFGPSVEVPTGNDDQHCAHPVGGLVMNSTTAQNFVKDVVSKYNTAHPDKPISYTKDFPTVGEFVDVLNIAQELHVQDVSKSAVCELGRKMTQVSRDPDIKEWYNELGAFFAYINKESVFYPAKYYKEANNCDKRFMGVKEGICAKQVLEKFHHNNYTYKGKVGMNKYQDSAHQLGLPGGTAASRTPATDYPLAALAQGISFDGFNNCYNRTGSGKWSCGDQVLKYRDKYRFLIDKRVDQGTEAGNACNGLDGNMKVDDALRYVKKACEIGLNVKPYSVSGREGSGGSPVHNPGSSQNPGLNEQ